MSTVRAVRELRSMAAFGACLAMATLLGCGGGDSSKASISGKVTYKGAPLPSGTLTLTPESGPPFSVNIKPDGTFTSSDIPVGTMGVSIVTGMGGPAMSMPAGTDQSALPKVVPIPAKYKDPKTSGLTWELKGGKNPKDFELTD